MKPTIRFAVFGVSVVAALISGCSTEIDRAPAPLQGNSLTQKGPALIRYEYKEGEITQLCQAAIDQANAALQAIIEIQPKDRTVDNTLLAFEEATANLQDATLPLQFMGYVSTSEALRDEGSACEESGGKYFIDVLSRAPLYDAIKDLKTRNEEEARLLSEAKRGFEVNGLSLPAAVRNEVKSLKQSLTEAETLFTKNLNNDKTKVELSAEELEGLSEDFIGQLKEKAADGKKFIISVTPPNYLEIAMNAKRSSTRKLMLQGWVTRGTTGGANNVKVLEDAIGLRQKIAEKFSSLGFKNWADYRTANKMAKNSTAVTEFLNGLRAKLAEKNRQDLQVLLDFKKKLDPTATKIEQWDIRYLEYQYKKQNLELDDTEIQSYFPAQTVIAGMFEVYQTLLGVDFLEVKDANTWAPNVQQFEIYDRTSKKLIAKFLMDLYPRQNGGQKYSHAAAFTLISGRRLKDGTYSIPVSSVVANFTPPTDDKPSLLTHDEVDTLFHEFGHIMHQTLTRAAYASLSGSSTVHDFVEAPSQMLENWVWSPEILSKLSGHYKTQEKLPKALLDRMIQARDFNVGYYWTRQLYYGLMDLSYHNTTTPVDTTKIANSLYKELFGIDPVEGNRDQASFGHLMGGYDAGYYGYLWSKVFAEDMFTRFAGGNLLSPTVGADYRKWILEQGNMKDAETLVNGFLGRHWNQRAFLIRLGLATAQ